MALPSEWIDRIFARLAVRYGSAWLTKWNGIDIAAVKADWAEELGGFSANPDAIKYALEHLPLDSPPTVLQFRALCIGRPDPNTKALPAPKASDERVAAVVEATKQAIPNRMNLEWAHRLRKREQMLDRTLTITQKAMWRAALRGQPEAGQP